MRWEYKTIDLSKECDGIAVENKLNDLSAKGWELVSSSRVSQGHDLLILERPRKPHARPASKQKMVLTLEGKKVVSAVVTPSTNGRKS